MAKDETTTAPAASTSVSDANATSETLQFIETLRQSVNKLTAQLAAKTAALTSAETRKDKVTADLENAKKHRDTTAENLLKAITAKSDLAGVIKFFNTRKAVTSKMSSEAKNVALTVFESLAYVTNEGAERVEQLQTTVLGANANADSDSKWTNTFVTSISETMQLGRAAMSDGKDAVAAAFTGYRSCQQIDMRTGEYLRYFKEFHTQLKEIIQRLTTENTMAEQRVLALEGQLTVVDARVLDLTGDKDSLSFELARATARYNAAQAGAEYSGASSAGS